MLDYLKHAELRTLGVGRGAPVLFRFDVVKLERDPQLLAILHICYFALPYAILQTLRYLALPSAMLRYLPPHCKSIIRHNNKNKYNRASYN